MCIQENNIVLDNRINIGFKLFTTIKKRIIVELSSKQVSMKASAHSSKAKQAGVKLMYTTRRHHIRCGYHSQHG